MKITQQQALMAALEARGCRPVPCNSRKYLAYSRPDADGYYFVGKAGALRAGINVTHSISLEGARQRLLVEGAAVLKRRETS